MRPTEVFQAWADLLQYPGEKGSALIQQRIDEIRTAAPELGPDLQRMVDYAASHGDSDLEEVFTRTFDSNAERALEVGWHLHGENYARGAFMVRMRNLLRELEVEETAELPDHLSHVLSVLARANPELTAALAKGVVAPALAKIADGFSDDRNPYYGIVVGLKRYIDNEREGPSDE